MNYKRNKFFETGEYYELISKENDNDGEEDFSFNNTALVVDTTGRTEFILVRSKDFYLNEPFFELCGIHNGTYNGQSCVNDKASLCYSAVELMQKPENACYGTDLLTIVMKDGYLYDDKGGLISIIPSPNEYCKKFYYKKSQDNFGDLYYLAISKDEIYSRSSKLFSEIKSVPLPNNDNLIQIKIRIYQKYCGSILRFPNSFIAIDPPPPITTTKKIATTKRKTTHIIPPKITTQKVVIASNSSGNKTAADSDSSDSSVIPTIGIVCGALALILLLIVAGVFIARYIIKRRKQKSTTIPLAPRDTQSMQSIELPPPPPKSASSLPPYIDPALDKTQSLSIIIPSKSKTTPTTPRTQPSQQKAKVNIDAAGGIGSKDHPLKMGTKEMLSKEQKEGSGGNVAVAAEKTDSDSSEIPLPALTVDQTKTFTKIYKNEFDRGKEDSMASEENCGENVYKIDGFCMQKIPLPDEAMATWPADYVENMALRAPNIEHRGQFHLQAVIMANNLLLKKGIKNIRGKLCGSTKGMKWLKSRTNIPFVQFIAESIEGSPDGTGQEFLSSKIQWRRHLKKLDVVETFRQSCFLGQTKQRREFFLLATFYKMELLLREFPREDHLKTFPFPVPMLLEVRKEAPQFFEIIDEKLPVPEKKSAEAAVAPKSSLSTLNSKIQE
uniref:Uncharacterized protein n=1 Tax=Panagrolaimus sp. PS1159 TaxID=55785 RepID=A0AC35F2Q9_9BILA